MTYEISDTVSHHNEDMRGDTCGKCAGETDTHDAPCPEALTPYTIAHAEADDAQRRADMMPSTYTYEGQFTPAQQETRRRFAAVAVALADDGFIIEDNSHVAELIERYAVAYAKASK